MMKREIKTSKGSIFAPFFMPDATRGLVKLLTSQELEQSGTEAVVVNTYHLLLQPGTRIIKKFNGVHGFMDWERPVLSDSGGFQVFSLLYNNPRMGKIEDDKVVFKSPLDGQEIDLTPEMSIRTQFDLGADMMVCLDDCPPNNMGKNELKRSVGRTIAWAKRCRDEYDRLIKKRGEEYHKKPLLFAVIQGGGDLELRKYCAQELIDIGFDGYGFGAMPTNDKGEFDIKLLSYTAELIPDDAFKFALGIGNPEDIVNSAKAGWDMFDCVIPTREGRHGKIFERLSQDPFSGGFYTSLNINNTKFKTDTTPINKESGLDILRQYSRGYLHYLFKLKDPLGYRLASLNNLEFYNKLMRNIREQ